MLLYFYFSLWLQMLKKEFFFSAYYPSFLSAFLQGEQLAVRRRKNFNFQWCQFFLLSEVIAIVQN